jgi:hypothetical protein
MRKLLMWIVVTIGIAALVRKLRSRRGDEASELEASSTSGGVLPDEDPADELRRKLSETRTTAASVVDAPADSTIDERRAEVHDEGRSTIDEMQRSSEG